MTTTTILLNSPHLAMIETNGNIDDMNSECLLELTFSLNHQDL